MWTRYYTKKPEIPCKPQLKTRKINLLQEKLSENIRESKELLKNIKFGLPDKTTIICSHNKHLPQYGKRVDIFSKDSCKHIVTSELTSMKKNNLNSKKFKTNKAAGWQDIQSYSIQTHNHLVCKRTLSHLAKLAKLAKWLSVRLRTKCLWFPILLQSLKLQISRLFWARSSLTFRLL